MPSFELNRLQGPLGSRALNSSDKARLDKAATDAERASNAGKVQANAKGIAVEIDATIARTEPPVDSDRVAEVRQALRNGSYPLVPAKVVDAMIAARLSFGLGL